MLQIIWQGPADLGMVMVCASATHAGHSWSYAVCRISSTGSRVWMRSCTWCAFLRVHSCNCTPLLTLPNRLDGMALLHLRLILHG